MAEASDPYQHPAVAKSRLADHSQPAVPDREGRTGTANLPAGGAAMGHPTIDWPGLRATATEAAHRAYAPYSRLRVGAAGLTADGRVITGCNVENASYGLTLCAECGLVSTLHATRPP